jgi:hypothetical protein
MTEPMITGRQPDSGKPTVRDERGACGNVGYGRGYTGTYSGNAETAKPQPKVARAAFLPDSFYFEDEHVANKANLGIGRYGPDLNPYDARPCAI